jgi:hypothetical protein
MPNWCENILKVTGPAEDRRWLTQLWTDGQGVFNRILPTPDPFTDQEIAELRVELERSYFGSDFIKADAANAWYWWRNIHWGTKWDVGGGSRNTVTVEEQEDVTTIDFLTAWGPPEPVIKAMSAQYPSLIFDLTYFEGGMCFAGETRFVAGEGQGKDYEYDDPEYERIASEFGYGEEEDDEGHDDDDHHTQELA